MTEQRNIKNNIKGEKPLRDYDIIYVRKIGNASEVLENFKQAVLIFLNNKNLHYQDKKWEELLPSNIVNKINQLDDNDFAKDEFLDYFDASIYNFQKIKDWEWYSSLEVENGFDIVVKGDFNTFQFINFIHCQNVPLDNIKLLDGNENKLYDLQTIRDYTTYKILK